MLDLAGIEVAITVLSQTSLIFSSSGMSCSPNCCSSLVYLYTGLDHTVVFFQDFEDEYLEVTVTCCPAGYIGSAVETVS